ncbi:LacI family DNA-binding transcriptional regulator [Klenkia sp. PcliD-1-E]|uniref:LacI family DNA-binding transcriptional regulator n=1 Tax=Klenkia sp. PcliD-1-E TaxID=2954492 RepID=UPI0020977F65|nr:LacI family DNA-binding transcriptional regulator [Klenkia sp. PcliD-1-E]MCO7219160.1 LacI family DNA-binding transcriptional regulator [Klenkia sp. PcliD-1-E]
MSTDTHGSAPARPLVMSDVAARAGVSHQTVSRVVNGHPNVAPRTRERVQQAIEELGYRPNAAARALVTGSSRTIGLVTIDVDQYGPAQTMIGLEQAARAAGYSLSVAILDRAGGLTIAEAVDRFVAQSVDAVVVHTAEVQALEALEQVDPPVPLVAVQMGGEGLGTAITVGQEAGAQLAVDHLLELGHTTVHHLAGPSYSVEARRRIQGWRTALARAGAPPGELWLGDWWPSSGHAVGTDLARRIRAGEPITAVFAGNDQMALGLMVALHEQGITVPGDVSVVGFDDVPEAPYFSPPLTTVRQDFAELGRRGVGLVLARIAGEDAGSDEVDPQLLVRRSTGPVAG